MDLLSPKIIKELLTKYEAAPLKRMGQNFLINRGIMQKIIDAAKIGRGESVLEIGPGLGTLTQELAKRAKKVVAIEKDRKFVEILKETLKDHKNVKIIEEDILKLDIKSLEIDCLPSGDPPQGEKLKIARPPGLRPGEVGRGNWKLVANLPYYITSPVIRKFLEEKNKPKEMILMVQKEVAQRICACPPKMSLLAVSVQFYANPQIISYVSKGSFWPPPKVDSAILKITPIKLMPQIDASSFFKIVRAGFFAPRKQLAGNLAKGLKIERLLTEATFKKANIDPKQRAETLNVQDWIKLTELIKHQ